MIRRNRREEGAAATIVAVLFAMGVVLAMLALAVDGGNLWFERRQVQNGADAAAGQFAELCARNVADCNPSTAPAKLGALINANFPSDGRGALDSTRVNASNGLCGRVPGAVGLPQCASATSNAPIADLVECPALPTWLSTQPAIPYVEAYVATGSGTSPGILPRFFGSGGNVVKACARTAWGEASPPSENVLSITMSECDWKNQTGYNGTPGSATYPNGPVGAYPGYGASNPWPSTETVIYTKGNPTTCDTSAPGGTAPGGFAALSGVTSCQTTLTRGPDGYLWAKGDPGNDIPCSESAIQALLGKIIYIPIFDCMTNAPTTVTTTTNCSSGSGSNNYYRVSGFAAYYLSGWYLSSSVQNSLRPPNRRPCNGNERCLSGWFVADLRSDIPISPPSGPPGYGIRTVVPAG